MYDDNFARYKILPMIAGTYNNPRNCLQNTFKNYTFITQTTVGCDFINNDKCSGFVAVSNDDKAVIIAFQGSITAMQIMLEGYETVFDEKEKFLGGGKVSRYFYISWSLVWNGGLRDGYFTAKNLYPNYEVWVTGHSLGGSMAAIAAANIVYHNYTQNDNIKLITFGEPRTGDKDFALSIDQKIGYAYRVVHSHDPIPHLPLRDMLGYIHHKGEIFYDNNMSQGSPFTVCSSIDDNKQCSDKYINFNIFDHLFYFKDITLFGKLNCKQ
ncbi:Lipase, class 3 family-containing protein [Strongyloides ratti]|uniref:Lipase, class 3 family-containing protein n=1 Tax=Strongyloides ratti TaxID=34506 RepID=A0A090MMV0_STRRB|nr:Lipase, class 3 family-containing protein [Strongyloides ratti]CEF59356.1 Lipase, class 3 family-containing protein [Strongyloides ratti]